MSEFMNSFDVFRVHQAGKLGEGRIEPGRIEALDEGNVLIRVQYAGVNYKDALAGLGKGPIVRRYPCIGGVEAVGTVETSGDSGVPVGAEVIVHGYGLGVDRDGGFSPWLRVPAETVTILPEGLSMRDAAALGVAGHTVGVAIDLLEINGMKPGNGPIAVTGATGGTGSLAVAMLAGLGHEVTAISRKADKDGWLKSIGATNVMAMPDAPERPKPLEPTLWAGAIDTVGGAPLEWLTRTPQPQGAIAAFGNAAGLALNTSVLPFILRGVRLLGVNADTRPPFRGHIWQRLATDLKPRLLSDMAQELPLADLPALMDEMIAGRITGRYLVRFG